MFFSKNRSIKCTVFFFVFFTVGQVFGEASSSSDKKNQLNTEQQENKSESQQKNNNKQDDIELKTIVVDYVDYTGNLRNFQVIDSSQIHVRPTVDGGITDLLRNNPAVQFASGQRDSVQQGEIKPATISIHGAPGFQTKYSIDGISFNNDYDPVDEVDETIAKINSHEQGLYLDSRLIEEVNVRDSNVSAEYGGFTGGAVDVKVARWSGTNSGRVYYQHSSSKWNEELNGIASNSVLDSVNNDMSKRARFQPNYTKNTYGFSLVRGLTERLGLTLSASRRTSDMDMKLASGIYPDFQIDGSVYRIVPVDVRESGAKQTRTADNVLAKFTWDATESTRLDTTLNYSNHKSYSFPYSIYRGESNTYHKGYGIGTELTQEFTKGELLVSGSYQKMVDDRISPVNYQIVTNNTEREISKTTGGAGNLTNSSVKTQIKTGFNFNEITNRYFSHQIKMGFEYESTKANYRRDKPYLQWGVTGPKIDSSMHLDRIVAFLPANDSDKFTEYAAFYEHKFNFGKLTVVPGIRAQYNDSNKDINLAPRLVFDYDAFADKRLVFNAGLNRYYGRNLGAYRLLKSQLREMRLCHTDCSYDINAIGKSSWKNVYESTAVDNLKTPYSDELVLGVSSTLRDSYVLALRYVQRRYRNEVQQSGKWVGTDMSTSGMLRTYDNGGRADNKDISLSFKTIQPLTFFNTQHDILASLSWHKGTSNRHRALAYSDYDADPDLVLDKYYYNGRLINSNDLPYTDFNSPWHFNLELTHYFPRFNIVWFNGFNWYVSRKQPEQPEGRNYVETSAGKKYRLWHEQRYASRFTFDTRINWTVNVKNNPLTLGLEVTNVFNKKNEDGFYVFNGMRYTIYEPGRQVRFNVSYEF